jgi:hypothetical protein
MAVIQLPATTVEYIRIPVSATVAAGAVNPTNLTLEAQLVEGNGPPLDGQWDSASWETISGVHYARVLVSGLERGHRYRVFIRISDNPEQTVHLAGAVEAL